MQAPNKVTEKEFHAVKYMRQARMELTEQYLHDKKQYLEYLKNAMADFKVRQNKAIEQQLVHVN